MTFCFFDLITIFAIVDLVGDFLVSPFLRNRPKFLNILKTGLWIGSEICKNNLKNGKNGLGIIREILKNGFFILREIWKIRFEIM